MTVLYPSKGSVTFGLELLRSIEGQLVARWEKTMVWGVVEIVWSCLLFSYCCMFFVMSGHHLDPYLQIELYRVLHIIRKLIWLSKKKKKILRNNMRLLNHLHNHVAIKEFETIFKVIEVIFFNSSHAFDQKKISPLICMTNSTLKMPYLTPTWMPHMIAIETISLSPMDWSIWDQDTSICFTKPGTIPSISFIRRANQQL